MIKDRPLCFGSDEYMPTSRMCRYCKHNEDCHKEFSDRFVENVDIRYRRY